MMPLLRTMLAVCALVAPVAASAHSFWLQPVDHTPNVSEEVEVAFKVGDVGDGTAQVSDWGLYWERIAALQLHAPDRVIDAQANVRTTDESEAGSARITLSAPGTHVLAFASNPSFSDLEAARFDRYVAHEGLQAIAADRTAKGTARGNGTELYARRAKALFQVGRIFSEHVTEPIGQTLEIVPLVNPFQQLAGETGPQALPLRVLWRGTPLEGATLAAIPLDDMSRAVRYTSDSNGMVAIPAWDGAPTLFSVVWGEPAPNDARADYFTIFASLTVGR